MKLLNDAEAKEIAKQLWEKEDMQKFLIEKYDFYQLNDGLIIELEKVNKISINKTMYYDDECETPEKTEKNFIYYNRNNIPGHDLTNYLEEKEKLEKEGFATGKYDYKGIYLKSCYPDNNQVVICDWYDEKDKYFKRYLTKQEQKEYIELMKNRQEQYIERLKKYFKRYNKNISTYGYWANR